MVIELAQLPVAPVDPMAGWISLVVQLGALGILAYVVMYLAPQLMREVRADRAGMDERHARTLELLQTKFEARTSLTVAAIERQTERLERAMQAVCKSQENRRGPA